MWLGNSLPKFTSPETDFLALFGLLALTNCSPLLLRDWLVTGTMHEVEKRLEPALHSFV